MDKLAKNYISSYAKLKKWVKFLLCFLWAIPTNIYRFALSYQKKDALGMVISFIMICTAGFWFITVIDMITIICNDKVIWIDDLFKNEEAPKATSTDDTAKKEGDADEIK